MAIINILPNGLTAGNPSTTGNPMPEKRKDTIGWNYKVSARLKKWLYSVPTGSLDGFGYSFTLTVKDCPDTSDDWSTVRNSLIKRLFRTNCFRLQWLTEWQGRGVPHLHGVAYFSEEIDPDLIKYHWSDLTAAKYGSKSFAQDVKPIHAIKGWLDYLAKHSARGAYHYQRSPENIPTGWEKTGRMWGYRGEWNTRTPMQFHIDSEGYYQFRRIVKNLRKSKVRERFKNQLTGLINDNGKSMPLGLIKNVSHDRLNIVVRRFWHKSIFREYKASKVALQTNDEASGRMFGVSEWVDIDIAQRLIIWLGSQGYQVVQK